MAIYIDVVLTFGFVVFSVVNRFQDRRVVEPFARIASRFYVVVVVEPLARVASRFYVAVVVEPLARVASRFYVVVVVIVRNYQMIKTGMKRKYGC